MGTQGQCDTLQAEFLSGPSDRLYLEKWFCTSFQWVAIVESGGTAPFTLNSLSHRPWAVAWHQRVVVPLCTISNMVLDVQVPMFISVTGWFYGQMSTRMPIKSVHDNITVHFLKFQALLSCHLLAV